MKKRIFTLVLVLILVVSLVACGKKGAITQAEAQKIALTSAGLTDDQVQDAHIHITDQQGIPCYSVHITLTDGSDLSVLINAANGEVIG